MPRFYGDIVKPSSNKAADPGKEKKDETPGKDKKDEGGGK